MSDTTIERTSILSRNDARAAYDEADLSFFPMTRDRLVSLRNMINEELKVSGLFDDTFRADPPSKLKMNDRGYASIKGSSYYFRGRELVTFNGDGFIGFAGWASAENVQPILRGFILWVRHEAEVAELN